jgi:hypothetical protein
MKWSVWQRNMSSEGYANFKKNKLMKDNTTFEIRLGNTYHNNDGPDHEALGPSFENKSLRISRFGDCVPLGQVVP